MKFTGKGLIYDPKAGKVILNFKYIEDFETDDTHIIELLNKADHVVCIDDTINESVKETPKEPTRKELIEKAKEAGITGADRMKKEEILSKLED